MNQWFLHVKSLTGLSKSVQINMIQSALTFALVGMILFFLKKFIWKRSDNIQTRYTSYKIASYIVYVLGLLTILRIWITGTQSVVTYLGLLSAGLAIALQDLIGNLAGWVFIWMRRPFKMGERIQVADAIGDVIDIGLLQFSLLEVGNWIDAEQSTGRVIHIPNKHVLTKITANYVTGFEHIWDEIPVLVTFESDWEKAKTILTDIIEKQAIDVLKSAKKSIEASSHQYMIQYSNLTPIVYTDVRGSGVLLTMRYLCLPKSRRLSRQHIWEDILRSFSKHQDIDLAYPTRRAFNHMTEGKHA